MQRTVPMSWVVSLLAAVVTAIPAPVQAVSPLRLVLPPAITPASADEVATTCAQRITQAAGLRAAMEGDTSPATLDTLRAFDDLAAVRRCRRARRSRTWCCSPRCTSARGTWAAWRST